jgi:hypothetical protein
VYVHPDGQIEQVKKVSRRSRVKNAIEAGLPDGLFSNQKSQFWENWVNFGGSLQWNILVCF